MSGGSTASFKWRRIFWMILLSVIAAMIRRQGYEPVWKDFDQALVSESAHVAVG